MITIDHSAHPNGWYSAPMHTLPDNGYQSDLSSRLTHEMFHALGFAEKPLEVMAPSFVMPLLISAIAIGAV